MKKTVALLLSTAVLASLLVGCSSAETESSTTADTSTSTDTAVTSQTLTGEGDGYGGLITVSVTLEGDTITAVDVDAPNETAGVADPAIEGIPEAIVAAGTVDGVDAVAGATWTSNGIIYAVQNALDPVANPYPAVKEDVNAEAVAAAEATLGLGIATTGRLQGSDDTDTGVYAINEVYAAVVFDSEGRVVSMNIDQLEVTSPNYDGDNMPHLAGFPGQEYNYDENHDEVVDGTLTYATDDEYLAAIDGWQTKKERGDTYVMNSATWAEEIAVFEDTFVGMTVDEIYEWFYAYCADSNGRPLQEPTDSTSEENAAKFNALTEEEQAMLIDLTATATMSLNDGHGNILLAIEKAYENRVAVDAATITGFGLGVDTAGRIGPGSDDQGVQVYSINNAVAAVLLDEEGRIVALNIDQMEISTPNYDGASMPNFAGWPGQEYNYDEDHDEVVDGILGYDDDTFLAEILTWETKKERGDAYIMNTGTWADQIAYYQDLFIGMTADEVLAWFDAYCTDSGNPLEADSSDADEAAKYDALTDEEKAMLGDLTAGATMSLNDSHGYILDAIIDAMYTLKNVDITVG